MLGHFKALVFSSNLYTLGCHLNHYNYYPHGEDVAKTTHNHVHVFLTQLFQISLSSPLTGPRRQLSPMQMKYT